MPKCATFLSLLLHGARMASPLAKKKQRLRGTAQGVSGDQQQGVREEVPVAEARDVRAHEATIEGEGM